MKIRFVTPTIHGVLDYAAATGLIVFPFLLGLGDNSPIALWLSVAGGVGLIAYSLLTDYRYGAIHAISFRSHLVFDLLAALAFYSAPFIFGFEGLTTAYYFVMATGVLVVVGLSESGSTNLAPETAQIT